MKYTKHLFYILLAAAAFFLGYHLKMGDEIAVSPDSQPSAVVTYADDSAASIGSKKTVELSNEKKQTESAAKIKKNIISESEQGEASQKSRLQHISLEEREEYLKKMGEKIIERQRLQEIADAEQENNDNAQEDILLTEEGEVPEEEREDAGMRGLPQQETVSAERDIEEERDNLIESLKKSGMPEKDVKQAEEMFTREAASEEAEQKKNDEESARLSQFLNSLPDTDEMEKLSDEERGRIGEVIWEQQQ